MANFDVNTAPLAAPLADTDKLYVIGKKHRTVGDIKTAAQTGVVKPDGTTPFTAIQTGVAGTTGNELIVYSQLDAEALRAMNAESALGADLLATQAAVGVVPLAVDLGTFSPSAGPVGNNAVVKGALEQHEGSIVDLVSLTGVARDVSNLGALSLDLVALNATETIKSALQKLMGQISTASAAAGLTARVVSLESRDLEIGATVQSGNFNVVAGEMTPVTTSAGNAIGLAPATGTLTDGVEFAVVLFGVPGVGFTATIDVTTRSQTIHGRAENIIITDEVTPVRLRWSTTHATWFIVS
jgi:hypothetical protein